VDFIKRRIGVFRHDAAAPAGTPALSLQESVYPKIDSLEAEITGFLAAVRGESPPLVTGEDGLRALEAALLVDHELRRHWQRYIQPPGNV
jgi:predicted dehydrogenase